MKKATTISVLMTTNGKRNGGGVGNIKVSASNLSWMENKHPDPPLQNT